MFVSRLASAAGRLLAAAAALAAAAVVTAAVAAQPPAPRPAPPPAAPPAPGWREAYVLRFDQPVTALACGGDRLAAGTAAGELVLADAATGKNRVVKLPPLKNPGAAAARFDQLTFAADADRLYFVRGGGSMVGYTVPGDADGKAWGLGGGRGREVFDLAAGGKEWVEASGRAALIRPNPHHPGNRGAGGPPFVAAPRYKADVEHAALSPDGGRLAVATADGTIHLHDRAARGGDDLAAAAATIDLGRQTVTALGFSPDGGRLAVAGDNGFARLYDPRDGKEVAALKGHGGIVFAVAFGPDGGTVATGGDDHAARVWDAATGRLRAVLTGHTDSVTAVRFDPTGRVLVTASPDRTVRGWAAPR